MSFIISFFIIFSIHFSYAQTIRSGQKKEKPSKSLTPKICQSSPLQIGQTLKFYRPYTWTGLSSSHAIKKIDRDKYQATLNLNFIEQGEAGTENALKMKEQVLECIKHANKVIQGPDGETLKIKIIDPETALTMDPSDVPEKLDINVLPPKYPSNMLNFSTMDCANITHEVFHMMGLVDEYDDSLRAKSGKQETCRIIPTRNTLMGLPSTFFEEIFGKTTECKCGGTCQKFWAGSSPERRKYLETQNDPCSLLQALKTKSYVEGTNTDAVSHLTGEKLTIIRKPKAGNPSLLTANQFKKLLSGYCDKGIEGYAKCSSYSYFKLELSPGMINPQCSDIPQECSDDDYYLGVP